MTHIFAVSTPQAVGVAVAAIAFFAWLVYIVLQVRGTGEAPGAEIDFAPNRRPYLDDDQLEGKRLDNALGWALVLLVIVGVGLPLYWLNEPGRQAGAIKEFDEEAAGRGFHLFQPDGAPGGHNIGHFGCATCHGPKGEGGVTDFLLTDPADPEAPPRVVNWKAPALDTVLLRFTEDEVNRIITYGRPNTPMPAWGVVGGGPMNEQQVTDLVAYIKSIQLTPDEARKRHAKTGSDGDPLTGTDGKALFDGFCARCHTKGFSYGEPDEDAGGAFGPNLRDGVTVRQFPSFDAHVEFIMNGSDFEKPYGVRGVGSGRMPGFASMLTRAQIRAIVEYERSL